MGFSGGRKTVGSSPNISQDFFLVHFCLRACNEHQVPWVLDPVAAGFTPLRHGNGRNMDGEGENLMRNMSVPGMFGVKCELCLFLAGTFWLI